MAMRDSSGWSTLMSISFFIPVACPPATMVGWIVR
jgi:hypothetical protein